MGRGVLLGLVMLVLAACGGADPDLASSAGPTVPVLEVSVAGEVATLVANIVDPDGDLDMVLVEWGDGTSDTVTSGFPGVRLDHTYTGDGEFTIVLEARKASGQSVIATTGVSIAALAATADASAATTESSVGGSGAAGSGRSGRTGGGSTQPSPSPAPAPEPAPEELAPETIPDPVTVDLLNDEIVFNLESSDPDGAGGSAEAVQQGPHGFGLRAYAWHGYNGSASATGKLLRSVEARSVLADMPDHVTAVVAEVHYTVDANVELKGPHDRTSSFVVTVSDLDASGSGTTLTHMTVDNDNARPVQRTAANTHNGVLTTTLTRDRPTATFQVDAECTSTSGSQAFALLNEGYCDALEMGGVELLRLTVTFIPVIED